MRGFFSIGIFHAKKETNIGTLFRTASSFGAAYIFTVGKRYSRQSSDTIKAYKHVPLFHFKTIDDLVDHLPLECKLVGVELDSKAHSLPTYCHSSSCCYLLGAEDYGLNEEEKSKCHHLVQIPGSKHCLNVSTAGSIVLYDRYVKGLKL